MSNVDHPAHYGGVDNPYEAIKVIEAWGLGFCDGNALKYIARARHKGAHAEDIEKAIWYLKRYLQQIGGGDTSSMKRYLQQIGGGDTSSMKGEDFSDSSDESDRTDARRVADSAPAVNNREFRNMVLEEAAKAVEQSWKTHTVPTSPQLTKDRAAADVRALKD